MLKQIIELPRLLDPVAWVIAILTLLIAISQIQNHKLKNEVYHYKLAIDKANLFATTSAAQKEREFNQAINQLHQQHYVDIQNEKSKHNNYLRAVKSGAIRLSIPVSNNPACTTNSSTATRDQETRAELTPEAGAALTAIASEGNQAIIDLNFCIDAYNKARTILYEKDKPTHSVLD